MAYSDIVLLESDHARLAAVLEKLRQEANAKLTFLIDKNGQQIAFAGELVGIDPTSLASLAAGNVAATDGLAKLIGEKEFAILFHEGEHDHLHISLVGSRAVLLVLFDLRSSLGLVRLRVRKATADIGAVLDEVEARSATQSARAFGAAPFAEITDEDIDALFN